MKTERIEPEEPIGGSSEPAQGSEYLDKIQGMALMGFLVQHFKGGRFTKEQLRNELDEERIRQTGAPADGPDIVPYRSLAWLQAQDLIDADSKGNYWIKESA